MSWFPDDISGRVGGEAVHGALERGQMQANEEWNVGYELNKVDSPAFVLVDCFHDVVCKIFIQADIKPKRRGKQRTIHRECECMADTLNMVKTSCLVHIFT